MKNDHRTIKKLLIDRDLDVTRLAAIIHKTRGHTSRVIHNRCKSEPTRILIARTLKVKVSDLWPGDINSKEAA